MSQARQVRGRVMIDLHDFWRFSSISAISCRPVLVVEEAGYPERTTDHGQITGKLYHVRL